MKHTDYFDTFLTDTVNLSKLKLELLEVEYQPKAPADFNA